MSRINLLKDKNIKHTKADLRKKLPCKPMYGIFITNPRDFVFVFDLDGTIVDSIELHAKSFGFAIEKLGYENVRYLYKKYKENVGIPMEDIVKKIIPNISKKEMEKIRKLKDKYFLKNIKKVKVYKRVLRIIKLLRKIGVKIALFTSSPRKIAYSILRSFNLIDYFDYIVCKEDVRKPKPNEEGLIKIMKKLKAKRIVFIGDTKFDMISAKKANAKFINVRKFTKDKIYKILFVD